MALIFHEENVHLNLSETKQESNRIYKIREQTKKLYPKEFPLPTLDNSLSSNFYSRQQVAIPHMSRSQFKQLNSTVNGYLFYAKLGKGAYGYVYKALRETDSLVVAIKSVSKSNLKRMDVRGMEFLKTEIAVMGRLQSPHTVRLIDSFETDSTVYIVTEYCDQPTLEEHLQKQESLPFAQALAVFRQLLDGISALHEIPIIHRDLKPENIFQKQGLFKIGDFGFARELMLESQATTIRGTPAYMAPEVISGRGYDLRADLWSLGVIFYRMLFGDLPFHFKSPQQMHMMNTFRNHQPNFQAQSDVPKEAIDLLKRMLQIDPAQRINWDQLCEHDLFSEQKNLTTSKELLVRPVQAPVPVYQSKLRESMISSLKRPSNVYFKSNTEMMDKVYKSIISNYAIRRVPEREHCQKHSDGVDLELRKLDTLFKYVVEMSGQSRQFGYQCNQSRRLTEMRVLVAARCIVKVAEIDRLLAFQKDKHQEKTLMLKGLSQKITRGYEALAKTLKTFEDRLSHIVKDRLKSMTASEEYQNKEKLINGVPGVDYQEQQHTKYVLKFHKQLREKYSRQKKEQGLYGYLRVMGVYESLAVTMPAGRTENQTQKMLNEVDNLQLQAKHQIDAQLDKLL